MATDYQELKTDLEILKRETVQTREIMHRFDDAIVKISDVSQQLSKVIAVHESKLSQFEETDKILFQKLEEKQMSQDKNRDNLYKDISDLKTDFVEKVSRLESTDNQILTNIAELKTDMNRIHDKMEKHEKLRWIVVGGATVAFFLLQQLSSMFNWFG